MGGKFPIETALKLCSTLLYKITQIYPYFYHSTAQNTPISQILPPSLSSSSWQSWSNRHSAIIVVIIVVVMHPPHAASAVADAIIDVNPPSPLPLCPHPPLLSCPCWPCTCPRALVHPVSPSPLATTINYDRYHRRQWPPSPLPQLTMATTKSQRSLFIVDGSNSHQLQQVSMAAVAMASLPPLSTTMIGWWRRHQSSLQCRWQQPPLPPSSLVEVS